MPSDGKVLQGQLYDPNDDVVITYTEQMRDADTAIAENIGDARTEVIPHDRDSSLVKIYGDPTATLATIVNSYPTTVDLNLPDTLTSVTAVYNNLRGEGGSDEDAVGYSIGTHWSLNANLTATGQSSLSMIADLVIAIEQTSLRGRDVPATEYFFYMPNPVSQAQILTRLNTITGGTVNTMPRFTPKSSTITVIGQQMNLRVEAHVQKSKSVDPNNTSEMLVHGQGHSWDGGVSVRTYTIPPTIHGLISISNSLSTDSVSARAEANVQPGTNFSGWTELIEKTIGPLTASIFPSTLSATSPTAIPSTGLYLYKSNVTPYKFNHSIVRAIVVNFASV